MTEVGEGFTWTRWATNRTSVIDAILTPGGEDEAVASARLALPDDSRSHFRDPRYAALLLHFEPQRYVVEYPKLSYEQFLVVKIVKPIAVNQVGKPMPAVSPDAWDERIQRALDLPKALATFLSGELRLTTSGEPPVNVGVKLDAQQDMAELIDITGMQPLPGAARRREAIGYFLADRDGSPSADAARRMVTNVLRYTLGVERSFG